MHRAPELAYVMRSGSIWKYLFAFQAQSTCFAFRSRCMQLDHFWSYKQFKVASKLIRDCLDESYFVTFMVMKKLTFWHHLPKRTLGASRTKRLNLKDWDNLIQTNLNNKEYIWRALAHIELICIMNTLESNYPVGLQICHRRKVFYEQPKLDSNK